MKQVSNGFKEQIKSYGREFITRVSYNDGKITLLNDDDIVNATMSYQGSLLKSTMKELDLECTKSLKKGFILNYKFGLLVDDEYEFIDYGDFIINEVTRDANTGNFNIKAYDKMLYSMKMYEPLDITYPITVRNYIKKLCNKLGYAFENENDEFPNYDKLINKDYFKDLSYTYRDILDQLAQVTASIICINQNEKLELRYLNNTNETIDGDSLKDVNVEFGKTFGPINSIVLSRGEETDDMYKRDETSVKSNGLCELKIKDNLFMSDENRGEYIQAIYDELNGLKYAIVDYDSIGIGYLELGDMYNIELSKAIYPDENLYPSDDLYPSGETLTTIMLNDTFKTTTGISEIIYVDEPISSETDYTQATTYEKNERQADLLIERKLAKITIKAEQIDLEGAELNLTANDMTIKSTNFNVDKDGNVIAKSGTIGGNTIDGSGIYTGSGNNTAGIGKYGDRYAFWAGSTPNNTSNAPFRVGHDGTVNASNMNITGGDITMFSNENDPKFTLYDYDNIGEYYSYGFDLSTKNGKTLVMLYYYGQIPNSKMDFYGEFDDHFPTIQLDGQMGTITCDEVIQTSLEEKKKNIKLYKGALKEILNTDIYEYNLVNEDINSKKHLGFVIGKDRKYSKKIVALDKEGNESGVDNYSMTSLCLQAIKEQQEQIEELKEEIKKLKESE